MLMYRETMEQSWLSSTIDYVYNTVSGDERNRSGTSDYQKMCSNGVWINEPLETSCVRTRATPKQVRISFPFPFFVFLNWPILTHV